MNELQATSIKLKDWNYRTHQHGFVESRREQVRIQEALSMKEKSTSRYSDEKYARDGRNEESSRTASWWNLIAQIKRKLWDNTKNPLLSCRKCKIRWFLWMIQENFKKWSRIIVEHVLTLPVNLQRWLQVLAPCWAATNAFLLRHGIHQDYRENVFGNNFLRLIHPRDHHQGIHPCATQREQGSVPQATGSGTLFRKRWQTK